MSDSTGASSPDETMVSAMITTALIAVSVVFPVLSLTSVLLRYKSRMKARSGIKADDWWILVAWVSVLGLSVNAWVYASLAGINYYKINPLIGITMSLQCLLISSVILQVSLSVVKISILLFYRRIFVTPAFQIAASIGIALVSAWGIIFFFLVLFEGNPISASWTGEGSFRFNTVALGLGQSGSSIALDVLVLTFPVPLIFSLHLPLRKKIVVMLIFWLGAFCCIAAIVRLVLLHASLSKVASNDQMIEPNCSIIAACLPCYGHLVAGMRTPESIVRSVRSVRSILSLRSNTEGENSTKPSFVSSGLGVSHDHTKKGCESEANLTLPAYTEENTDNNPQRPRKDIVSINGGRNSDDSRDENEIDDMYPQGIRMETMINLSRSR